MSDNLNNPKEYDAVLGGNNAAPTNAVVLGGIEGVRRRLLSKVVEHQISALSDALNYAEEGLKLVIQALNNNYEEVHKLAYKFLKDKQELEIRDALDSYVQQSCFIRFDGFYYYKNKSEQYYIFRLYPDGTVLSTKAFYPQKNVNVFEKFAEWFYKSDNRFIKTMSYVIENNYLKFSETRGQYTIDYCGEIKMYGDAILLTSSGTTRLYSFIYVQTLI